MIKKIVLSITVILLFGVSVFLTIKLNKKNELLKKTEEQLQLIVINNVKRIYEKDDIYFEIISYNEEDMSYTVYAKNKSTNEFVHEYRYNVNNDSISEMSVFMLN